MSNVIYKGYKSKWNLVVSGYKKRINNNGYLQIFDSKTHRWVTVDIFLEDSAKVSEVIENETSTTD